MIQDDFEFEPIRGLPRRLPEGEQLLWQGAPDWRKVARSVFHVQLIAIYFALLLTWGVASALAEGRGAAGAAQSFIWVVPLSLVALGGLALMAWLTGRTTVYSITSKRVLMRIGIALPITINIPFKIIGAAAVKTDSEGFGDIPLTLSTKDKFAYFILWPHARPWRFGKPEPMMRSIPKAQRVAAILAGALVAANDPAPRPRSAPDLKVFDGALAVNADPRADADESVAPLREKAS
jgi:hypothetical protein